MSITWIIVLVFAAALWITGAIDSAAQKIVTSLNELAKKLDDLNDSIDVIMRDTNDIEGYVSERKEKFVNPIDPYL